MWLNDLEKAQIAIRMRMQLNEEATPLFRGQFQSGAVSMIPHQKHMDKVVMTHTQFVSLLDHGFCTRQLRDYGWLVVQATGIFSVCVKDAGNLTNAERVVTTFSGQRMVLEFVEVGYASCGRAQGSARVFRMSGKQQEIMDAVRQKGAKAVERGLASFLKQLVLLLQTTDFNRMHRNELPGQSCPLNDQYAIACWMYSEHGKEQYKENQQYRKRAYPFAKHSWSHWW